MVGDSPAITPTWFFELFMGGSGIALLVATYPRFRFSAVVYLVVAIHFVVLAIGAKYTYADAPLGNWFREALGLARNHFDRVGHFFQGCDAA